MRIILSLISIYYIAFSAVMWTMPMTWYESTPGVAAMGPFNLHFIRDVALAYLVSGAAILWGAWKADKTALVIGAAWPLLHAVFHIWIWMMRGFPYDQVALVNLLGIQLPAWIALVLASRFKRHHVLGNTALAPNTPPR